MPEISAAYVISVLVSICKPFLEKRIGTSGPVHDAAIQAMALLYGVVGFMGYAYSQGPVTADVFWTTLGNAVIASGTAIGGYHIITNVRNVRRDPRQQREVSPPEPIILPTGVSS